MEQLEEGVECARKRKRKVYETVVQPALMYSAEIWSVTESIENKMNAMEMKMLRFTCGATRMDKIRNEKRRKETKWQTEWEYLDLGDLDIR